MIQITEEKKEKMEDMCQKLLRLGGQMMRCLEEMDDEEPMHGMREYDAEDELYPRAGMRHGMRGGRSAMRSSNNY